MLNENHGTDKSRNELLCWINDITKSSLTKVEQLGTGAQYCALLEYVHPGKVPIQKVNFKAKNDYDFISNFKILQQAFQKLNITRPIDIERLIKCKYQDNFEFLTWFKKYFDQNCADQVPQQKFQQEQRPRNSLFATGTPQSTQENEPLPIERPQRGSSRVKLPPKVKTDPLPSSFVVPMSKNSSSSNLSLGDQEMIRQRNHEPKLEMLSQIETLKTEKEFYFNKLKDIDHILDQSENTSTEDLITRIRQIIYCTQDKLITVNDDGSLEITVKGPVQSTS